MSYEVFYDTFGIVCALAIFHRARRTPAGGGRNVWVLFGGGVLLWVVADVLLSVLTALNDGVEPYPTVADALYLGGYPMIAAAIVVAARRRGQGGRGVLLEGMIVTLAAAVPLWIHLVWPLLADTGAGTLPAVIGASYPLMDLLLLGAAVRLTFSGSVRRPGAGLLLAAGLFTTLASDVIYNLQTLAGTYSAQSLVDAGWLLGYALWAAGALHPSAGIALVPVRASSDRKRSAVVLASAVPLLVTVAVAYVQGTRVDAGLVLGGLGAISVLVGLRLRQLEEWRGPGLLFACVVVAVVLGTGLTELAQAEASATVSRLVNVLLLVAALGVFGGLALRFGREQVRRRATQDSEAGFRALVAGSADVLTVIGPDTSVLAYPETVERALGVRGVIGERFDTFLRPEDVATTHAVLAALRDHPGEARSLEWCLSRADGTAMDVEVSVTNHVDDPRLGGFVLNVRDVSERKRLEAALQHQAFHDHLTGLPNRALLEDRLRSALGRTAREPALQALLYLDLDDFKAVNDSLGHPVGDALLVEVAKRLGRGLRTADTLARMGGDEFAVLLEGIPSVEEGVATARRLLNALLEPIPLPGGEFTAGGSIGLAFSDGGEPGTAEEQAARLLRNADLAMYEAKRLGGGQIEVFAPELHAAVTRQIQLKSELQAGLERGEFCVHYQPIVTLADRRAVGFEALARWNHPADGLVGPGAFIAAAEQTGLIVELGAQVLRAACAEAVRWPGEPYVSVNVAGAQLARESFAGEVADALRDSGLPASRLVLEVTETALIADSEGNQRRMAALRSLGVKLAIDDFGTGYSSLNYLRRFPMDVLKIDKSFVDRVAVPGREQALVEAMIAMGNSLALNIVAEGIEAIDQAEVLAGRACAQGQGYLFARPMPAGEVAGYLGRECSNSTV